jgi:predicted nucleic acid-binding protein
VEETTRAPSVGNFLGQSAEPQAQVEGLTMLAVTFDTGALIALERGDKRMRVVLETVTLEHVRVIVPAVVVAEWWRGTSRRRKAILDAVDVEATSDRIARVAGEAMAVLPGTTTVDAIVMASAAQHGGIVYTSDLHDLERLREYFPSVRVLRA